MDENKIDLRIYIGSLIGMIWWLICTGSIMMGTILMRGWFRSCYHLNCEIIWRLRRTNRELSVARLNSSDADILISTLKLPDTIGKLTVVIDHYLSFSDLSRIKAAIQMVLEEKAEKYGEFGFEF